MVAQQVNRLSGIALVLLSALALLDVLIGLTQPLETDEGVGAHIFQLSVAALLPSALLFLASADWTQPRRAVRPLAFTGALTFLAFAALYHLEHVR